MINHTKFLSLSFYRLELSFFPLIVQYAHVNIDVFDVDGYLLNMSNYIRTKQHFNILTFLYMLICEIGILSHK